MVKYLTKNINFMDTHYQDDLRNSIALTAARLIVEEGFDYERAKNKALKLLKLDTRQSFNLLPSNEEIELEVTTYLDTFYGDTHPALIENLRIIALNWLDKLNQFNPYLVGPVLTGTATEHNDISIICDSHQSKELGFYLIDLKIDYKVTENLNYTTRMPTERYSFMWPLENTHNTQTGEHTKTLIGIHISIVSPEDSRNLWKRNQRANAKQLAALIKTT